MTGKASFIAVLLSVIFLTVGLWLGSTGWVTTQHSGVVVNRYPDPILFGLFGTVYHLVVRNGTALIDVKVGSSIYYGLPDNATYNWSTSSSSNLPLAIVLVVFAFAIPLQMAAKGSWWREL